MSILALNWAKEDCKARGSLRGIIMVLADHASPKPTLGTGRFHVCWTGQKTIANESGWSVRCVEDNIPKLAKYDIKVLPRRVPTPNGACNLYVFPISDSLEVPTAYVETDEEVPTSGVEVPTARTEVSTSHAEVPTGPAGKPKPEPKEEPELKPSPSSERATAEDVNLLCKETTEGVLWKDVGVGPGSAVTLEDLFRKIETLQIPPEKRLRAQNIARKLWVDTDGGKYLSGMPVRDLRAVLMTRPQGEGVIKKRRK
ncbi:MAG: hypothetical protein P8M65_07910 [Roseibacillus sp.]|nr:hypothetical protein [Roseibacillus sp.]